jgi:hypothetical protein
MKPTCPAVAAPRCLVMWRALRGNSGAVMLCGAQGFLSCRVADARDSGLSDPHTPRRLRSGRCLLGFMASEDMSCIPPGSRPQDVLPLLSGEVSPMRRARLDACDHGAGDFFQPCLSTTSDPLCSGQLRAAPPLRPWRSSAPELHLAAPDCGCLAAPAPPAPAGGAAPSRARAPRQHSPPPPLLAELLDPHGRMRLAPHLTFGEVAAAAAAAARSAAAAVISAAQNEHASAAVRASSRARSRLEGGCSAGWGRATGPARLPQGAAPERLPGHAACAAMLAGSGRDVTTAISGRHLAAGLPWGPALPCLWGLAGPAVCAGHALGMHRAACLIRMPAQLVTAACTCAGGAGGGAARGPRAERVGGMPGRAAQLLAGAVAYGGVPHGAGAWRFRDPYAHFGRIRRRRPLSMCAHAGSDY